MLLDKVQYLAQTGLIIATGKETSVDGFHGIVVTDAGVLVRFENGALLSLNMAETDEHLVLLSRGDNRHET
jgi:hypothetical protein